MLLMASDYDDSKCYNVTKSLFVKMVLLKFEMQILQSVSGFWNLDRREFRVE